MQEIAAYIREGANAFLKRESLAILYPVIGLALLLGFCLGWEIALSFIVGSSLAILSMLIGMNVSVRANVRTANAARVSIGRALVIAFRGGASMGLTIVGMNLIGIAGLYCLLGADPIATPRMIVGFGIGASLVALFAQLGGGIYTKGADVGADLVGKVEIGIPEDDPRNPAVIADQVGDNVGDCAGLGINLFQSLSANIIGVMVLGVAFLGVYGINAVFFPLMTQAVGLLACIAGVLSIGRVRSCMLAVNLAYVLTAALCAAGIYLISVYMMRDVMLFYCALLGMILSLVVALSIQYFTALRGRPVRRIAEAAQSGAAINIMTGFSYGMMSSLPPILVVALTIMLSYLIRGVYGVAAATLGIFSVIGIIMSSNSFGPIIDNADGIAEMAGLADDVKEVSDQLDAVGNVTKTVAKGYAMVCAYLSSLVLLLAYLKEAHLATINLANPATMVGLFIGASMPFVFSALAILAVSKTAHQMVDEVRRQFRHIKGLLEGRAKPDYSACIDLCTRNALREMILPTLLVAISPVAVGFILGREALGAFLVAVIAVGALLALTMVSAGGALDNAKKLIETGFLGGKRTPTHASAVTGDTYGDPLKDTAGPALHIAQKLVSIIALAIAPLLIHYALL